MANAVIQINNLLPTALSLDMRFDTPGGRVIRNRLAPAGSPVVGGVGPSIDVGDITDLQELNRDPQFRRLWDQNRVNITISPGSNDIPGAIDVVSNAIGLGGDVILEIPMTSGGTSGTADDITLYNASFPYAARMSNFSIMVVTAVGASTVQLRDAAAGAGNTLSQALSSAAAGRVNDNGTGETGGSGVVPTLARNGSLFIRRSDRSVTGTARVTFHRLS